MTDSKNKSKPFTKRMNDSTVTMIERSSSPAALMGNLSGIRAGTAARAIKAAVEQCVKKLSKFTKTLQDASSVDDDADLSG